MDFDQAPLVLTWEITRACALECIHCRAEACPDRHPEELTTVEAKRVIDRVTAFTPRPPYLVFSGGDPLERPDLNELVEHAVGRGLQVAVTPASSPRLTRDALRSLREAGAVRVALSLDGATAASHDGFRGEPGSFARVWQAAGEAVDLGLTIQVNSTVTRATASEFPRIAAAVEEMGAVMWEVFFLVPVGRGRLLEPLSADETEEFLGWLYRTQEDASYRIITVEAPHYRRVARQVERERRANVTEGSADRARSRRVRVGSTGDGKGFMFISHTGDVFPSGFLPVPAGNVRNDDLVTVYREHPLFRSLRDPEKLLGKCGVCEYRALCGGARARAWAVTGNELAPDPFCAYIPLRYRRMMEAGDAPPPEPYRFRRSRGLPVLGG
jgi:AdoMet-dependent heme synthase